MSSQANRPIEERSSLGLESLRLAAFVVVFAAQLLLGSRLASMPPAYCLTRPFWLDEFHTLALVKEERADQLLFKLSRGGDFSPPGLHLVLWVLSKLTNASDEVLLRSFSCAIALAGFFATYFLLRMRFSWRVSWVAVLGMWSCSSLLLQQMFEGRFYSFWFATAAILCWLLTLSSKGAGKVGAGQAVCVAAVAALMCSVHYFGIITLALIAGSQLCLNFHDVRQRRMVAVALAAGATTLIASLPFYFGQRAALPVPTWIDPPTLRACAAFMDVFALTYAMTLPVFANAFQALIGRNAAADASPETGADFRIYAGACAMLLLPLAIIVFSYVIQPAQIARYALPAVLAYAPLIALLAHRLNGAVLAGTALLFFVVGVRSAVPVYEVRPDFHEAAAIVKAASSERPLVVHSRHVAYPLCRYTGARPQVVRISYLFRGDKLSRLEELEQAVARRMGDLFDLPKTLEPEELASLNEFYLLASQGEEQRYRGWTAEPLNVVVGTLQGFKMRRAP